MNKFSKILFPAAALTVICLVISLALAVANSVTKDKIEQNTLLEKQKIAQTVLKDAVEFEEITYDGILVYKALDNKGEVIGYVFETVSSGYGGDMTVMTAIAADGKLTGVKVVSSSETPGLGKNAEKDSFLSRFIGTEGMLNVVKGPAGDNEISAITGATISSRAVVNAVNAARSAFEEIKEQ
ncbi:MAG TPA: RnfABCDGE type electron transport complex subunit G [Clostridia bacterium]|nr:RnfABCDGE type electron transport complex subunit G [Clostridia bacterium]